MKIPARTVAKSPWARRLGLLRLEDRLVPSAPDVMQPFHIMKPFGGGSPDPSDVTPDMVRSAYGINKLNFGLTKADGAGITIAIVDAYHDPVAVHDLTAFDAFYGTPENELNARPVSSFFTQVGQDGGAPPSATDSDWIGEISLDIEWAHAIAPMANIILVEADDASANLNKAVQWALTNSNISVISDSWGSDEYSSEVSEDNQWITPSGRSGVTVLFSAGDSGVVSYPSASQNVVSVGATNIQFASDGSYLGETAWSYDPSDDSGGGSGKSQFETKPGFQNSVTSVVGTSRGTSDISANGGPDSAVSVYDSFDDASQPWQAVWGTSESCPIWAGLVAMLDQARALPYVNLSAYDTSTLLPDLYASKSADFHDITSGKNASGDSAGPGYDLVTGIGSPITTKLFPDLIPHITPGITLSAASGLVTTELGGQASFTVVLDSQPTADVTISISSTNTKEGTVSTSLLTFTSANFNTPQTVTITGVADHKIDPDVAYTIVTGVASSSDSDYAGIDPPDVNVTNLNEDFADFIYSSTSGLFTTEAGGKATFTVKLASQPSADVTIQLLSSNTSEGTVSPSSLTFTSQNWMLTQTVTVTGVDDIAIDSDIAYKIITGAATSLDTGYSGFNPADISLTNVNDDTKLTVADLGSNHRYRDLVTVQATVFGLNNHPTTGTVAFSYVDPVSLTVVSLPGTYPVVNGVASISTTLLPIGNDTITAVYSGDSFYHTSTGSLKVLIGRALLTVTPDALSKVYGASMPFLSFSAVGYVDNDTSVVFNGNLTTTATASSPVGTFPVTLGSLDASPKYDISFVPNVLFTVTKAPLTITALLTTKVYGAAVPALPIAPPAFVNSDTASVLSGALTTTATQTSVVGTYPIALGSLSAGGNYTITFVSANLTVSPATVAITPAPKSKQYGPDPVPALTYTSSGFLNINGDSAALLTGSLATSATAASIVGQYPITVGTLSAGPNYTLSLPTVFVTVTPAPLTVTANSLTSRDGGAIPKLTYTATGFVNNDVQSMLTGVSLSTPATVDSAAGTYPITVTGGAAPNYTLNLVNGTLTLTLSVVLVGANRFAVGGDAGGTDIVTAYDASGSALFTLEPFPGFTGGLRTATGDVTGDGVPDVAVGTGPGAATVDLFDGATGNLLTSLTPFDDFTGGVYVTLGDMNGDGKAELVVTPDAGGGPRVKIFQGGSFAVIHDFYGIDDTNFRGGARSALGDMNGDGYADLVISAGFGGGPRLSILDGKQLSQNIFGFLTSDFFAFSNTLRNGAFVAVGDVDGDGFADLIAGAGPGGGPQVIVLSGKTLMTQGSIAAMKSPMASFFGGNPNSRNGVFVSARNLDGDAHSDVIVGDGSVAIALQGKSLAHGGVSELYEIGTDGGPTGGVFVG